MIYFRETSSTLILDLCYRPLCFSEPGDEFYGLRMFDRTPAQLEREMILQLGIQGTCTLLKYRARHFVVFARHQIALIPNESSENFATRMRGLYVLMDDGQDGWNLPINNFIFSFDTQDGGDEDDFVVAVVETGMLRPFMLDCFFPVERHPYGEVGNFGLAGGYPMSSQELLMQVDGNRTAKAAKTGIISARTAGSTAVLQYNRDAENLDGMSGGPIFVTRLSGRPNADEIFIAFLDGIIQRGGNGYVRYLTIERILEKIDSRLFA